MVVPENSIVHSMVHSMAHSTIPVRIPVQKLETPIILTTSNHFLLDVGSCSLPLTTLQVHKALRETEDHNTRLHAYIEGLLLVIMEKHPDILEKRS